MGLIRKLVPSIALNTAGGASKALGAVSVALLMECLSMDTLADRLAARGPDR